MQLGNMLARLGAVMTTPMALLIMTCMMTLAYCMAVAMSAATRMIIMLAGMMSTCMHMMADIVAVANMMAVMKCQSHIKLQI